MMLEPEQDRGHNNKHKPSTSVIPPEGSELMANTGPLQSWMPSGLIRNVINKGNGERFVAFTFVPSAGADSGESFAAILENRGKVLNLRQKVPNLALDPVRFHRGLAGYDEDNIQISIATAQITSMRASISSTHATPEIWQDCRIPLPFPVQETFIREKDCESDVYAAGEKSGVLVFKVTMKAQVSITSRAGAIGKVNMLD
jgi:hypothetical protein